MVGAGGSGHTARRKPSGDAFGSGGSSGDIVSSRWRSAHAVLREGRAIEWGRMSVGVYTLVYIYYLFCVSRCIRSIYCTFIVHFGPIVCTQFIVPGIQGRGRYRYRNGAHYDIDN